jgi:uncharacterized protein
MAKMIPVVVVLALLLTACQGEEDAVAPVVPSQQGIAAAQVPGLPAPVGVEGVTVSGVGRVLEAPDTLRATVGVQVTRTDVDTAFDDAATAADRVLAAVREAGVAEEDIQTGEFAVNPEYDYREEGPPAITGYMVRNLVQVIIRDVDAAGELLAGVVDAAGDDARVEGLRFSLEDNVDQLRAARAAAFDDARRKAEHYAELAGAELGALVSVMEVGADRPEPFAMEDDAAADTARAEAPIMPGQQEVGVVLQATWALR